VIKSRRMRWAGHVARMGTGRVHVGLWLGRLREGDHLEDLGTGGRIILKWIYNKQDRELTPISNNARMCCKCPVLFRLCN
jgi:hypothetical protein